jgi:glycerol uptake facilitator-like aquaporin
MYKVINTKTGKIAAGLFAPLTIGAALMSIQLMMNGSKTTVSEAMNAGYRIVRA